MRLLIICYNDGKYWVANLRENIVQMIAPQASTICQNSVLDFQFCCQINKAG